jgi:hypothetical protein
MVTDHYRSQSQSVASLLPEYFRASFIVPSCCSACCTSFCRRSRSSHMTAGFVPGSTSAFTALCMHRNPCYPLLSPTPAPGPSLFIPSICLVSKTSHRPLLQPQARMNICKQTAVPTSHTIRQQYFVFHFSLEHLSLLPLQLH